MTFNRKNFLLQSKVAEDLYRVVEHLPIEDFHCHLSPQEIFEDKPFENAVQVWLGGDHYKWRLMRANGVSERLITGDATPEEKFEAWAKTLAKAFGNPLYHWSHLELKQVFGIDDYVTPDNWKEIYDRMNQTIAEEQLSPRKLIKRANVEFIGTTDNPLDSLEWHQKIAEDTAFDTVVAPTFRPDEAFVSHPNFANFVTRLQEVTGVEVRSFDSFVKALEQRIEFFVANGCKASDISFGEILYKRASKEELDAIFAKVIRGEVPTLEDIQQWQTEVFSALCGLYKKHHLVTQVHFGAVRDTNRKYFEKIGVDAGFDSTGDQTHLALALNKLLNALEESNRLPKCIFYNLNPSYNDILANTLANFQVNEEGIKGRLQFGAAWWFSDTEKGMREQMLVLANQSLLWNFVGMLTDSRSFLSYQRHDYFRRILVSLVTEWIESGRIPYDEKLITEFLEAICYKNAKEFFELN